MSKLTYKAPEVAAILGVAESTVRQWSREGKLRTIRIDDVVRFPAKAIDYFAAYGVWPASDPVDVAREARREQLLDRREVLMAELAMIDRKIGELDGRDAALQIRTRGQRK